MEYQVWAFVAPTVIELVLSRSLTHFLLVVALYSWLSRDLEKIPQVFLDPKRAQEHEILGSIVQAAASTLLQALFAG